MHVNKRYNYVNPRGIDLEQKVISGFNSHYQLVNILKEIGCEKFLLVCDGSFKFLSVKDYFDKLSFKYTVFDEFKPNPLYENVVNGVEAFKKNGCDTIVAVGGGSAIDVAKCIKLFACLDSKINYLNQEYKSSNIPLIAIPSTAGTGSESTRYAVIYYKGNKQSVAHKCIIPNYVILDHSILKTLPVYQKKCTMLDALCQGIESWWSVNSTDESKKYSEIAVKKIIEYKDEYINGNSDDAAEQIMLAANFAGRAINITQTTAAHAMSYKITSLYNLPHGHAVAICLPQLWLFMISNIDKCSDARGEEYLMCIFNDISNAFGKSNVVEAIKYFDDMLDLMNIIRPKSNLQELKVLAESVNIERLKNNPVTISKADFFDLYKEVLNYGESD